MNNRSFELGNLFSNSSGDLDQERIQTLVQRTQACIQQIVSKGHSSPNGFWYDQPDDEWVVLLSGAARLEFEDTVVELKPGDHLLIPANCRHRVAWTDPNRESVWLAVFLESTDQGLA